MPKIPQSVVTMHRVPLSNFHYGTTLINGKSAAVNGYLGRRFKLPFYQTLSHYRP